MPLLTRVFSQKNDSRLSRNQYHRISFLVIKNTPLLNKTPRQQKLSYYFYLGFALVLLDHPALLVPVVRILDVVLPFQRKISPALEVYPVLVEVVHL